MVVLVCCLQPEKTKIFVYFCFVGIDGQSFNVYRIKMEMKDESHNRYKSSLIILINPQ